MTSSLVNIPECEIICFCISVVFDTLHRNRLEGKNENSYEEKGHSLLHGDTHNLFENVYSELSIYVIINFNLK